MLLNNEKRRKEIMRHFRVSKARNTKKLAKAVVYVMACQSIVGNTMVANAANITIDDTSSTTCEANSGDSVTVRTNDKEVSISGEADSIGIVQGNGNDIDITADVKDMVYVGSDNNNVTAHKDVGDSNGGMDGIQVVGSNNTVNAEKDINGTLNVSGNGNTVTTEGDVTNGVVMNGTQNNISIGGNVSGNITGKNNSTTENANNIEIDGDVNKSGAYNNSITGKDNVTIHGSLSDSDINISGGKLIVDGDANNVSVTPQEGNAEIDIKGNISSDSTWLYNGTSIHVGGDYTTNNNLGGAGKVNIDIDGNLYTNGGLDNLSQATDLNMNVGRNTNVGGNMQVANGKVNIGGKLSGTDNPNSGSYINTSNVNLTVKNGIKNIDVFATNGSKINISGDIEHSEDKERLGYMAQVTSVNSEVNLKDGEYNCRLIQVTPGNEDTVPGANAIFLNGANGNTVTLKNYDINAEYNGLNGTLSSLYADEKSSITAENNAVTTTKDSTNIEFLGDIDAGKTAVTFTKGINFKSLGTVSGDENVFMKTDFSGDYNDSITVWQASGQKLIATDDTNVTDAQIQQAESNIQYVIKQSDVEHGTIEILPTIGTVSFKDSNGTDHEYRVALEDQVVRVKITPDTGYKIKSTGAGTCELTSLGNSLYELTVPRFGGVNISALMEAIIDDTKNNNNNSNNNNNNSGVGDHGTDNNNSGTGGNDNNNNTNKPILIPSIPQTPALSIVGESGSDSYEYGPAHESYDDKHMWTTTMHGNFKETPQGKKFIGLDGVEVTGCVQIAEGNGKYNWYLFDDNGLMQTGWHTLRDGKWYYFYADGHMAKDEVTPDGYYVDYTGAYNEVEHINLQ